MPAGDDRGARRRPQGTRRARRRVPRVDRVVGRSAARLPPPRHDRAGAGGRRRGAGVLEGGARGVPRRPASSGAGSTVRPMFLPRCRSRRIRARRRRSPRSTTPRTCDQAQVAIKAFEVDYGAKWPKAVAKIIDDARRAAGVLRLPRRALDPPAHDQSDRVHLRHRAACGQRSPRAPAPAPPESRWRSSSSSPHKPAGAPSTHPTSSRWSVPARCSTRANSSNDPTNQRR